MLEELFNLETEEEANQLKNTFHLRVSLLDDDEDDDEEDMSEEDIDDDEEEEEEVEPYELQEELDTLEEEYSALTDFLSAMEENEPLFDDSSEYKRWEKRCDMLKDLISELEDQISEVEEKLEELEQKPNIK